MSFSSPSGSPGGKPPAGKDAQRRKLLIYGGLAAVMLLVVMMSRKSSASSASTDTSSGSSAVPDSGLDSSEDTGDDDGSGAGGIDDSADLGNIDSDLQQLSQQIAAEQNTATSPGSTSGADPNIAAIGSILSGFQTPSSTTNTYRTTVMPGAGGGAAKTRTTRTAKPPSGKRDARGAAVKGAKRVGPPRTRTRK